MSSSADTSEVNKVHVQNLGLGRRLLRLFNPRNQIRIMHIYFVPYLLNLYGERFYTILDECQLRETRKSDTVIIFGSGYSINGIKVHEWQEFAKHDTLSFNWFMHQKFVRIDYHLIREVCSNVYDPTIWQPKLNEYGRLISGNALYSKTVFLVHAGMRATMGNRMISLKILESGRRVFRFKNTSYRGIGHPSLSLKKGLYHAGTLADCVNFAYLLGWRRVVLVGVDLYDRRYFWLDRNQTREADNYRGASFQDKHNVADATLSLMNDWNIQFAQERIEVSIYNPRSLLAQVLPVYKSRQFKNSD